MNPSLVAGGGPTNTSMWVCLGCECVCVGESVFAGVCMWFLHPYSAALANSGYVADGYSCRLWLPSSLR